MSPLISFALGLLLFAFTALTLLLLLLLLGLLVLLILLALDLLLERNGVDRRGLVRDALRSMRGASLTPGRESGRAEEEAAAAAPPRSSPRIPFSARWSTPAKAAPGAAEQEVRAPETASPPDQSIPVSAVAPADEAMDAPTETLPVTAPPTAATRPARSPRTARVAATRRPPTSAEVGTRSGAAAAETARAAAVAPEPDAPSPLEPPTSAALPGDRESAIDRLFAPLMESDTTEPLPAPRAARPRRGSPPKDTDAD